MSGLRLRVGAVPFSLFRTVCDSPTELVHERDGKGRKGKKVRFVAVGPLAQRLIEDYLDAAGHRADIEGPLFRPVKNNSTGTLAKPLNPQSLYESIVLHYAKKVGITKDTHGFCVHSLRATAATNSLQNGADIAEVQQWLGHANDLW